MRHLLFAVCLLGTSTILAAQVPKSNHVVIVLEENHSYSSVIGSSSMPYLNSLASQYTVSFTRGGDKPKVTKFETTRGAKVQATPWMR